MKEFNKKALESALTLSRGESPESEKFREDIKTSGEALMSQVRG